MENKPSGSFPIIDARAVQEVLDAVTEIRSRGHSREEAIVLIADRVKADWCGRRQTWNERKRRIGCVLQAITDLSKGGVA